MNKSLAMWCLVSGLFVSVASARAHAAPGRARAPLPTGPSPVAFEVEAVADTWQWRWTLRNVSDAPVEVASDRRLVWVELQQVTPRGRGRTLARSLRCVHDARPAGPEGAARTSLAPGQRYSELVDLRDLCGLRIPATMTPGAAVTLHYGFESPTTRRGARPPVARWMARTIVLDDRTYPVNDLTATAAVPSGEPAGAEAAAASRLALRGHDARAATGEGLRVSVSLRNETTRPIWALWRTVLFGFEVETPSGQRVGCDALRRDAGPFRDLFVSLAAGASRSVRLVPQEYCPLGTFDEAGLYRVRAVFESRADGEPWVRGAVFTGRAVSVPFLFRVSRGRTSYRPRGLAISG